MKKSKLLTSEDVLNINANILLIKSGLEVYLISGGFHMNRAEEPSYFLNDGRRPKRFEALFFSAGCTFTYNMCICGIL